MHYFVFKSWFYFKVQSLNFEVILILWLILMDYVLVTPI
jgi:hypothetical protein